MGAHLLVSVWIVCTRDTSVWTKSDIHSHDGEGFSYKAVFCWDIIKGFVWSVIG